MLRIGPFELDFPVVQAALSGYSDAPMRLLARDFGVQYALHEVVLDKSLVMAPKVRRKLVGTVSEKDHPVAGQLMGAQPGVFAEAAAILVQEGFDVIDINFGCPVKKVLGRCRGGYLLSTPAMAIEIVRSVRAAVPREVPVTIKMRRGMDDSADSERAFFQIFDAAFALGVAAITVHGRTVKQKYVGPSNWEFLARVKRHAGDRTILGSGDLYTAEDIRRMLEHTGVDGVTVARGCIGNPWVFTDARALLRGAPLPEPPSVAEQRRVLLRHFALAEAEYGPEKAPRSMRKFGIRYSEVHPHPKKVREAFVRAWNRAGWDAALAEWYDPGRDWPPGRRKTGAGDLIAAGASLCETGFDEEA